MVLTLCDIGTLRFVLDCIYIILALIFLITVFYITCRYIIYYKRNRKELPPTLLFVTGLLYSFITLGLLSCNLMNGIYQIISCHKWSWIIFLSQRILYCIQTYCLWIILFLRLYFVFIDSIYTLHKCTIYIFGFVFILMPFFAVSLFLPFIMVSIRWILSFVTFSITIFISLGISLLFLCKLQIVYKSMINCVTHNDELLSIITKNTILVIISITFSLINFTQLLLTAMQWDQLVVNIRNFTFLLDAYTNFICIMLTYKLFESHYQFLCGRLDKNCQKCCQFCGKINNKNQITKQALEIVHCNTDTPSSVCSTRNSTVSATINSI